VNGRERLIAVARGAGTDRKPVIGWPAACVDSDAVVESGFPAKPIGDSPDRVWLAAVSNPFGRALRGGIGLSQILEDDPAKGEEILDSQEEKCRREIREALRQGFDGVLYLVYGARSLHTTPMKYGGHYLERDRGLLSELGDAAFNMVFVVGEEDTYLDFVSDLPAHAFGWDAAATGVSVAQVRQMRTGALATNSPEADIELCFGLSDPAVWLENAIRNPKSRRARRRAIEDRAEIRNPVTYAL